MQDKDIGFICFIEQNLGQDYGGGLRTKMSYRNTD